MATSDAIKKAVRKYDKEHTRQILLKLNKRTDADVLQKLDSVKSKQGYVKKLIREDIKNNTKGEEDYGKEENGTAGTDESVCSTENE